MSQIAESGAFFPQVDLSCDNPLFSAQQRETICGAGGPAQAEGDPDVWEEVYIGKRNVEGGPRQQDIQHLLIVESSVFAGLLTIHGATTYLLTLAT